MFAFDVVITQSVSLVQRDFMWFKAKFNWFCVEEFPSALHCIVQHFTIVIVIWCGSPEREKKTYLFEYPRLRLIS